MYTVKGLEYVQRYQILFKNKYPNIQFMQVPHYYLSRHLRSGYLGMKVSNNTKKYTLADLDTIARETAGISWSVYGMKKVDSMNRRLQLNTYKPDYICEASNKVYPLSDLNNKQVIKLIQLLGLPLPVMYSEHRSSGEDVGDVSYLMWLIEHWPNDFQRVVEAFPGCRQMVYEHLNK